MGTSNGTNLNASIYLIHGTSVCGVHTVHRVLPVQDLQEYMKGRMQSNPRAENTADKLLVIFGASFARATFRPFVRWLNGRTRSSGEHYTLSEAPAGALAVVRLSV